ncbi:MAG: hypothetical protein K2Y32_05475 [Candidatus Obscuribacterales bacterium]|nr:hypothetical protein [Candidatus Obscuribacterales bacterium]
MKSPPKGAQPVPDINVDGKLAVKPKLLFVGNSLTCSNFSPWLVREFFYCAGKPVEAIMIAYPGETLESHYHTARTLLDVESGNYDIVVLQEASDLTLEPKRFARYLYLLRNALSRANLRRQASGLEPSQIFFFQDYSEKGDQKNQEKLSTLTKVAVESAGAGDGIAMQIIPIGEHFKNAQISNGQIELFQGDKHHPSQAGSYLIALSLFRDIYRTYYKHDLEKKIIEKLPSRVDFAFEKQQHETQADSQFKKPAQAQILVNLDENTAKALKKLVFTEQLQEKRKF